MTRSSKRACKYFFKQVNLLWLTLLQKFVYVPEIDMFIYFCSQKFIGSTTLKLYWTESKTINFADSEACEFAFTRIKYKMIIVKPGIL